MAERQEWYFGSEEGSTTLQSATQFSGQTFTIGTVGPNLTFIVESVDIRVSKTVSPGVLNVEIREVSEASGKPTSVVLASGSIAEADVSASTAWSNIVLTSQGTLQANKQYAVIFNAPNSDGGNRYELASDTSSPGYTGGSTVESTGGGDTTWNLNTGADQGFQINGGSYEGTLCTLADAVNKAGTNANANAIKEVLVSDWVKQAEGKINAVTRFDWVAKYPSLTNQVKYI